MAKYKRHKRRPAQGKRTNKFKSGLEATFARMIVQAGLSADYEPDRFRVVVQSHYTPDWKISKNVYIETKGYFSPSNRSKLLSFKEQYPDIKIHLVFGESRNKLNKNSKTTYGQWATAHGFLWCDIRDGIPKEWWK